MERKLDFREIKLRKARAIKRHIEWQRRNGLEPTVAAQVWIDWLNKQKGA